MKVSSNSTKNSTKKLGASGYTSLAAYQSANRKRLADQAVLRDPSKSQYFKDRRNGGIIEAASNTPVASNQNFDALGTTVTKPGTATAASSLYGAPAFQDGRPLSPNVYGLAGPGGSLGGDSAGVTGVSGREGPNGNEGGITSGQAGSYGDFGQYSQGLGGYGVPQTGGVGLLGGFQAPQTGEPQKEITGEQVAGAQYGATTQGAQSDLQNAFLDYARGSEFLGQNYEANSQMVSQQQQILLDQANRAMAEAQAAQDIDEAKMQLEYEAAVQQVQANRLSENKYLMQKLAGAGALDSTAGVEMLSKSAEKYDQIVGQMTGQKMVALSQFALADSKITNQYTTTVENVTMQVMQLQQQLASEFQSSMLQLESDFRGARSGAEGRQQQAYADYVSTLYGLQEARKEAELAAQQAAAEAQQQAFDNAISLAGLTGTYIDPFTGEEIRTLNGMKFDMDAMGGGSGGAGSSGAKAEDLSMLIQKGLQYGILNQSQVQTIMNDASSAQGGIGAKAQVWANMLNNQISKYEGANYGAYGSLGLPQSVYGGIKQSVFGTRNMIPSSTQEYWSYDYDAEGNPTGSSLSIK